MSEMIDPSTVADLGLSKICFGCEPLGGTDWGNVDIDEIGRAIGVAMELGINFFDTAAVYGLGESERRLARILGNRRHDAIIATKGGLSWDKNGSSGRARIIKNCSRANLREGVEDSLRRLGLEQIPLYYIHWPDPETDLRDSFEFLMQLREEGKIAHIACSNFNADQVSSACEVADVSYVQISCNLLGQGPDKDLEYVCRNNGIGIIAYNVLAYGLLTGKFIEESNFPVNDRRSRLPLFRGDVYKSALQQVATLKFESTMVNMTMAQYAISWVLCQPGVVSAVLGIKNVKQLIENYGALSKMILLKRESV